uniref:Uncharacterized protein n=1 Tax=Rhizophora mucronata TaxID=61149 RepID=A0A2P2P924_RHIMU
MVPYNVKSFITTLMMALSQPRSTLRYILNN